MEVLIQSQLQGNCKLEVPEGLKDLMADISREVLRAQPENLYSFISDYLSALLVTREHLTIACRICRDAAEVASLPTLVEELKTAGFQDEEAQIAADIIFKYFEDDKVKEENLINQLIKKTVIQSNQLPAVQSAIQKAFLRQKQKEILMDKKSSKIIDDDISRAVEHTLDVYEKTNPSEQQYIAMATRIQAAYKGYGVRRFKPEHSHSGASSESVDDTDDPESTILEEDHNKPDDKDKEVYKKRVKTLSSHSLAGSLVNLPKYRPYCITEHSLIEEIENATFDYTLSDNNDEKEAKIIFYNPNTAPEEEMKKEVKLKDDHHIIYIEETDGFAHDESDASVEDLAVMAACDDEAENNARSEKIIVKKSSSFLV